MRAIQSDMILTSASTRADGSLSIRLSTPELAPPEKTVFFELLNKSLKVIIQPTSDPVDEIVEVKAPLGFKSPSQRLRSVLFVAFQQQKPPDTTFEEWYLRKMEAIIERQKQQLQPE